VFNKLKITKVRREWVSGDSNPLPRFVLWLFRAGESLFLCDPTSANVMQSR
jgi:hypothetical protein